MAKIVKKRRLKSTQGVDPSHSALFAKKIFLVLIFLMAQYLFVASDFFRVKEISILGNSRVSDSRIIQTANIPMDHNVITLPMNQFRDRLASIHWIKDVKVRWHLPGKVSIKVVEREAKILVRRNGAPKPNKWYAVDEDGMALYEAPPGEEKKFPRLVTTDPVRVGNSIPSKKVTTTREMDRWISADLKRCLLYYTVDHRGEAVLFVNRKGQKYKIKIGKVKNMNRKMEVLGALLELVDQGKIKVLFIDVRSSQPAIMPIKTAKAQSDGEKSDDKN